MVTEVCRSNKELCIYYKIFFSLKQKASGIIVLDQNIFYIISRIYYNYWLLMHKILGPIFFPISKSKSALNSSNEKNVLKYENPKPYICNTQKSSFSGHFCTEKWLMGKLKKQIKRDFFRSIRQRRQGKAGVYLLC